MSTSNSTPAGMQGGDVGGVKGGNPLERRGEIIRPPSIINSYSKVAVAEPSHFLSFGGSEGGRDAAPSNGRGASFPVQARSLPPGAAYAPKMDYSRPAATSAVGPEVASFSTPFSSLPKVQLHAEQPPFPTERSNSMPLLASSKPPNLSSHQHYSSLMMPTATTTKTTKMTGSSPPVIAMPSTLRPMIDTSNPFPSKKANSLPTSLRSSPTTTSPSFAYPTSSVSNSGATAEAEGEAVKEESAAASKEESNHSLAAPKKKVSMGSVGLLTSVPENSSGASPVSSSALSNPTADEVLDASPSSKRPSISLSSPSATAVSFASSASSYATTATVAAAAAITTMQNPTLSPSQADSNQPLEAFTSSATTDSVVPSSDLVTGGPSATVLAPVSHPGLPSSRPSSVTGTEAVRRSTAEEGASQPAIPPTSTAVKAEGHLSSTSTTSLGESRSRLPLNAEEQGDAGVEEIHTVAPTPMEAVPIASTMVFPLGGNKFRSFHLEQEEERAGARVVAGGDTFAEDISSTKERTVRSNAAPIAVKNPSTRLPLSMSSARQQRDSLLSPLNNLTPLEVIGSGPYPSLRPQPLPTSTGMTTGNGAGGPSRPPPPVFMDPQPEICVECMMRDRDMIDVDVTGDGVWERESDAAFEEAVRAEQEEEQHREEFGFVGGSDESSGDPWRRGSTSKEGIGTAGSGGVNTLGSVATVGSRESAGGRSSSLGLTSRKRIGKGQPLTSTGLKLWTSMNPPASVHRWRTLQGFLATQIHLLELERHAREATFSERQRSEREQVEQQMRSSDVRQSAPALLGSLAGRAGNIRSSKVLPNGLVIANINVDRDEKQERARVRSRNRDVSGDEQAHRISLASYIPQATATTYPMSASPSVRTYASGDQPWLSAQPRRFSSPAVKDDGVLTNQNVSPSAVSMRSFGFSQYARSSTDLRTPYYGHRQRSISPNRPSLMEDRPHSMWSKFRQSASQSVLSFAPSGSMMDMHLGLSMDKHGGGHYPFDMYTSASDPHGNRTFERDIDTHLQQQEIGNVEEKRKKKGIKGFFSKLTGGERRRSRTRPTGYQSQLEGGNPTVVTSPDDEGYLIPPPSLSALANEPRYHQRSYSNSSVDSFQMPHTPPPPQHPRALSAPLIKNTTGTMPYSAPPFTTEYTRTCVGDLGVGGPADRASVLSYASNRSRTTPARIAAPSHSAGAGISSGSVNKVLAAGERPCMESTTTLEPMIYCERSASPEVLASEVYTHPQQQYEVLGRIDDAAGGGIPVVVRKEKSLPSLPYEAQRHGLVHTDPSTMPGYYSGGGDRGVQIRTGDLQYQNHREVDDRHYHPNSPYGGFQSGSRSAYSLQTPSLTNAGGGGGDGGGGGRGGGGGDKSGNRFFTHFGNTDRSAPLSTGNLVRDQSPARSGAGRFGIGSSGNEWDDEVGGGTKAKAHRTKVWGVNLSRFSPRGISPGGNTSGKKKAEDHAYNGDTLSAASFAGVGQHTDGTGDQENYGDYGDPSFQSHQTPRNGGRISSGGVRSDIFQGIARDSQEGLISVRF